MMSENDQNGGSTSLIIGLLFLLIILVLLLLYLYKHLNRKTDGQYTVQRLVFSPGGLRDRVMQAVQAVESRVPNLRSRLQNRDEEEGSDEDNQHGNDDEKEAQEGRAQNVCTGEDKDEDNSSDDYSSVDLRERVKQSHTTEEQKKEEEKESEDGAVKNDSKQSEDEKNEERVGLLIDLKSFSGSAIWSGEKEKSSVTAL